MLLSSKFWMMVPRFVCGGITGRRCMHGRMFNPQTVAKFMFRSVGEEGEVASIGVDVDLELSSSLWFQLYGVESVGFQGYHDYTGTNWKDYVIPMGDYFTGAGTYMTFGNDADGGQLTDIFFKDIKLGQDADDDGWLNKEEYDMGTDPQDPMDP